MPDSNASSSLSLPVPMQAGGRGLPGLAKPDRAAGFLLHAAPLAGVVLPLIGHLLAPWLAYVCMRRAHPAIAAHWAAVRVDQLWWGIAGMLGWVAVATLGLAGLFLALAVTVPWAILVVVSASQAEAGQRVRRWLPGT